MQHVATLGTVLLSILLFLSLIINIHPVGTLGFKTRIAPPYPHARRKRRLNWGGFLGITIKRFAPYRCLGGHVKEPYEMSMALGARP